MRRNVNSGGTSANTSSKTVPRGKATKATKPDDDQVDDDEEEELMLPSKRKRSKVEIKKDEAGFDVKKLKTKHHQGSGKKDGDFNDELENPENDEYVL
jgi:hypothetical protein